MTRTRPLIETIDFRLLSQTAPALAGDLAYLRFCLPHLSERRSEDHSQLVDRARFHLRHAEWRRYPMPEGELATFAFHPDSQPALGSVMVLHGWTSESSFMAVIGEQLRRAGFRVMLVDCPAHGLSAGRRTSLIACARAVAHLADQAGQPDAVVAHSMGCLAALLAMEGRAPIATAMRKTRLVFFSPPNAFQEVTKSFGETLGLGRRAQRVFEHHLERIARREIETFTAARLLGKLGVPALLVHARDDFEVGFHASREIAESCPGAELVPIKHGGHRRILYSGPAIRAAVTFLTS